MVVVVVVELVVGSPANKARNGSIVSSGLVDMAVELAMATQMGWMTRCREQGRRWV